MLRDSPKTISHALGLLAAGVMLAAVLATPALAETRTTPWWHLSTASAPTNLPPGGEGEIALTAIDAGDRAVNAPGSSVTVTDRLPAGVEALAGRVRGRAAILAFVGSPDEAPGPVACESSGELVTCTFEGPKPLLPFVPLEIFIMVKVDPGASSGEGEVTISGGEAPSMSQKQQLTVSGAENRFGLESYELAAENEDGSPDRRAGSHPFQLTTRFAVNETFLDEPTLDGKKFGPLQSPVALAKDVQVKLPPGLLGNVTALPQCSESEFAPANKGSTNECPPDTAIGVTEVTLLEPEEAPFGVSNTVGGLATATVPVFNLVPARGEPARFGFDASGNLVTLDTSVRTGEDYGVVTSVSKITQIASLLSSQVTLWGVPGDPRHDQSRGWSCLAISSKGNCVPLDESQPPPFLTLPTSCNEPLRSTVLADSWDEPGQWQEKTFESPALEGCGKLSFDPSLSVEPETQAGSTPTGLKVDVHVPQEGILSEQGVAEADVKDATVTLPQGMQLNPSAANGLEACSEPDIGFEGFKSFEAETETPAFTSTLPTPFCPNGSKVGVVHIKTPLLSHELEGGIYLATQNANPFGSLVAMYIVAEDSVSGVLVKLAGNVSLNAATGQVVSTFGDTPQTPFEDLRVEFFGGPTGALTTPPSCGTYTTEASFSPWSGTNAAPGAVAAASSYPITSNCTAPSSPQPFAPGFQAGTNSNQAGAFTPFILTINRPDGHQALERITMHLPPGLAAEIAAVTPCPATLNGEQCAADYPGSLVGHTTSVTGLGTTPYSLPGRLYLTDGYDGAPFGLLVVTPAIAGPFNLGVVEVRSKVNVDPNTAAVTVTSDPLPTMRQRHPVQLKQINVTVERPGNQPSSSTRPTATRWRSQAR